MRTEADAALALLSSDVDNKSVPLRTGAVMGLGVAYAGSHREEILQLLLPSISDESLTLEVISINTLALGFVFVGSANGEITGTILQTLMERVEKDDSELYGKWARFLALGLALLFLGK